MASFELWIGDIYEELALECQAHNDSAILIDQSNLKQCLDSPPKIAYTSLADLKDLQSLLDLCRLADHIHYYPPVSWSDADNKGVSKQKYWSEYVIRSMAGRAKITGNPVVDPDQIILKSDMLANYRRTNQLQGWAVGCSITVGVGVDQDQCWHRLFFDKIGLDYSVLAKSASSISWQSDQICRSDLKKGDLVVWAMTCPVRRSLFVSGELKHITGRSFGKDPSLLEKINPDDLTNDDLLYQHVMSVRRAYNYCKKSGADLLILGVLWDFSGVLYLADVPNSQQDMIWPESFKDIGSDGEHPGAKHHADLAKKFLLMYNMVSGKQI